MERSLEADETLLAICDETKGRSEIDVESGGPIATCVYPKLIHLEYASQSLSSADEKGGNSTKYLIHLANPENHGDYIDKMNSERLKLVSIIQK